MAKLTATLINGAAIACLIGASFGPWLNPALDWGWKSMALFVAAGAIHAIAQFVLSLGFEKDE
jgi:predicted MFS family arabinose efflux permease